MPFRRYGLDREFPLPVKAIQASPEAFRLREHKMESTDVPVEADDEPRTGQPERRTALEAYERAERGLQEREPALRADQIMSSPVVTLHPKARFDEAWRLVCERRFRHVPVLSEEGKLVGILSDRDLLREAAGVGNGSEGGGDRPTCSIPVRDFMRTGVIAATPDTEIREIARMLFEERTGAMPIVDEEERLVGIVTRSDILRALVKHAPLEIWI
jgi:acetoin utilization protein AcuB